MTNSCSKQLVVVRLPNRARRIPILTYLLILLVVCFDILRERCVAEEKLYQGSLYLLTVFSLLHVFSH